jgi:GR25 family glycosyltransferase involved in LPS biosynthesis
MSFLFDHTNAFCISVNDTRWLKMERRFKNEGLDVMRWRATLPDEVDHYVFYEVLNPLQRACAQSHINIWKYMLAAGLEYAFIMEDDACFKRGWREELSELYDMLYWKDVIGDEECGDGCVPWDAIFLNASEPMPNINCWNIVREQYFGGGYILSKSGAKWLLDRFSGKFYSTDWMTTRLQELGRSYSYYPWLIIQEGKDSTIGSGVDLDHAKVLRCLSQIDYSIDNYFI